MLKAIMLDVVLWKIGYWVNMPVHVEMIECSMEVAAVAHWFMLKILFTPRGLLLLENLLEHFSTGY